MISEQTYNDTHQPLVESCAELCEKTYKGLFKAFDGSTASKALISEIKYFLIQESFCAGGLFRSLILGQRVNDVDIFFKSSEAAAQFIEYLTFKEPSLAFERLTQSMFTPHLSYNISVNKMYKIPTKINFTTSNTGLPTTVVERFDFSFNKNYYEFSTGKIKIHTHLFNKQGRISNGEPNPLNTYHRYLRFLKDGFTIPSIEGLRLLEMAKRQANGNFSDTTPPSTGSEGSRSRPRYGEIRPTLRQAPPPRPTWETTSYGR